MTNELEKARNDIDQSITQDPYNGWAYRNKGIYYLMTKQYDDAVRVLKQAEAMDPFIDKVYIYLSEAYLQTKDFENACKAYKKSVENHEEGSTSMKPCK